MFASNITTVIKCQALSQSYCQYWKKIIEHNGEYNTWFIILNVNKSMDICNKKVLWIDLMQRFQNNFPEINCIQYYKPKLYSISILNRKLLNQIFNQKIALSSAKSHRIDPIARMQIDLDHKDTKAQIWWKNTCRLRSSTQFTT